MNSRAPGDYFCNAISKSEEELAEFLFLKVFRKDFSEPGFAVLDFQQQITAIQLRALMVNLKRQLSHYLQNEINQKLNYQWIGTFDQQETTKFHRDNASAQSFLLLGYEPSEINSQLFFADYSKFAHAHNLSNEVYFSDYNPIFHAGEKYLTPYITEIDNFKKEHFKIVLMNNSSLESGQTHGVLHKAVIIEKEESKSRVINSIMLQMAALEARDELTEEKEADFLAGN